MERRSAGEYWFERRAGSDDVNSGQELLANANAWIGGGCCEEEEKEEEDEKRKILKMSLTRGEHLIIREVQMEYVQFHCRHGFQQEIKVRERHIVPCNIQQDAAVAEAGDVVDEQNTHLRVILE